MLHCLHTKVGLVAAALLISGTAGCALNGSAGPRSSTPPPQTEWIRTELFFGLTERGKAIDGAQWHDFVDRSITPRFPDGLTLVYGQGQYRGGDQAVHQEPTAILIVLHPKATRRRDDALLTAIAREYDQRFHQESVLRCDSEAQVQFIAVEPVSGR
jgi:hypothetical protein